MDGPTQHGLRPVPVNRVCNPGLQPIQCAGGAWQQAADYLGIEYRWEKGDHRVAPGEVTVWKVVGGVSGGMDRSGRSGCLLRLVSGRGLNLQLRRWGRQKNGSSQLCVRILPSLVYARASWTFEMDDFKFLFLFFFKSVMICLRKLKSFF